jgi:membrane protein implicated in regulation of membrane protease activity
MYTWLIWLIAAAGFIIAELFSLDLVLIMFGAGALVAALAAGLQAPLLLQTLLFAGIAIAGVVLVRPLAKRRLAAGEPATKHGMEAVRGAEALVLTRVDEHSGLVKIGGEEWSARAYDAAQTFEPGEKVNVIEVKGATALVWRQPS